MPRNSPRPGTPPGIRSNCALAPLPAPIAPVPIDGRRKPRYHILITLGQRISLRRLDTNSIVLIVLAAGFVFLIVNPAAIEGLTSITFGAFKAEFAQLRLKQELQQRQVD